MAQWSSTTTFHDGSEVFSAGERADGVSAFGWPEGFQGDYPIFRMGDIYSQPKLEAASIMLADPGDAVDVGLMGVAGTRAAPNGIPAGWPLGTIYGWPRDTAGSHVPNVPDAMTGPLYGRTSQIIHRSLVAASPTDRGGTLELYATPIGEVSSRLRAWIGPTPGVVFAGRATYEDRAGGPVYPDDVTTQQTIGGVTHGFGGYLSSVQGAHSPVNTYPQGNIHVIASDSSVWPFLAAREYGAQDVGWNFGIDHETDALTLGAVGASNAVRVYTFDRAALRLTGNDFKLILDDSNGADWSFRAADDKLRIRGETAGGDFMEISTTAIDALNGAVYSVAGKQVVGPRGAAIADPAGGTNIDFEARTVIGAMLEALRSHGLIEP